MVVSLSKIQWAIQLNYCPKLIDINLNRRMLVTAESHNDILGKWTSGRKKKTNKKTHPSTDYKASTYYLRKGNWKKMVGMGGGGCVRSYHIQSIVDTEVFTLSSFYGHKKTEHPLIYYLTSVLIITCEAFEWQLSVHCFGLNQSGKMMLSEWRNWTLGWPKGQHENIASIKKINCLSQSPFLPLGQVRNDNLPSCTKSLMFAYRFKRKI